MRRLRNIGRLFTGTPAGVIGDAAVICDGEEIAWCGKHGDEPRGLMESVTEEHDCEGGLVTAGLIDAHTHPVYAGDRMAEVAMRTAGVASYEAVAKAGGGIRATVTATRAEDIDALEQATARRLWSWLEGGATTVEAKTGYHLTRDGELEATRLLARLSTRIDLPRVEVTFLAAHALPPDRWTRMGAYAKRGSRLAAELHVVSADHLLRANRGDAVALARAGVVATLAPGTALSIGKLPPVKELLDEGAVIALGTDHNPGTSGITSMSVVVGLAVAVFKMSVERALLAATLGGAFSISRSDRGVVAPHKLADLVLWEAEHEGAFAWAYGLKPRIVWLRGTQVFAD